jgi:guanylate kinase
MIDASHVNQTNAMPPANAGSGSGLLLVISGPSGVGKTTITHEVERRLGGVFSVSVTTRPKTSADVEGRDYYFLSDEEFSARRAAGELLEWAEVFGKYKYGTLCQPVVDQLAVGHLMILEIDVQGALQVKSKMPDAFMLFVLPPSDEELLNRLRRRGRESEEAIQRRFSAAKHEIATAKASGAYDAFIVNDDLAHAIYEACRLVQDRRGMMYPSEGVS